MQYNLKDQIQFQGGIVIKSTEMCPWLISVDPADYAHAEIFYYDKWVQVYTYEK